MTNKEAYEMREKREKELKDELLRVQCEGEDKGYIYAGRLDFEYSEIWFQVEVFTAAGRVYPHYFACKTLADLKEAICDDLTRLGEKRMKADTPFDTQRVGFILHNPVYVGDLQLQKQAPRDYLTKKPLNADYKTHYVTDDHEGIVSRDVWNKAQERLNRPRGKYPHFLDGKVFCGRCGEVYKRQKFYTGGEYFAWSCASMVRREKTCRNHYIREEELLEELCGALDCDRDGLEAEVETWLERVVITDGGVDVVLK